MPCEQCHVQFTVFKRKKSCSDCKRYYCHSCLVSTRKHSLLCDRCLLFSRRPLQRSDLVQLKTKDLIFYLQSKHISTAGCVEKEDLIDLVMRMDSNQNPSSSSGSSSKSSSKSTTPQHQPTSAGNGGTGADAGTGGNTNSFDNIKQTCQNFFSSLSENISDSFANLESRACSKSRADRQNRSAANVTEQPRVATREIPTYASRQQRTVSVDVSSPTESTHARSPISVSSSLPPQPERQTSALSSPQSPTSIEIGTVAEEPQPTATTERKSPTRIAEEGDCECSDEEELIATFSTRTRSPKIAIEPSLSNDETDLANAGGPSTSASTSKPSSQYSKLEIYINEEEESSHSSFEELGAIGGISDDSKTTTDTTSNTTDQWQMLDLKQDGSSNQTLATPDGNNSTLQQPAEETTSPKPQPSAPPPAPPLRLKKVTRRRSESYLNRRRPQISLEEDEDDEDGTILSVSIHNPAPRIEEETQTSSTTSNTTAKRCCLRCGKNKVNIRHQVEKLRKHLESSQMSESDIKQELREFLAYLEQRTKSVEYSDSEAGTSTPSATGLTESQMAQQRDFTVSGSSAAFNYFPEANIAANQSEKESRFINLDDYDSIKQLEGLSVKQLKEVLMLHRVDYKGCCEKQELLDRVGRLWKNLKSTPAVDKLPTDELCKICMDAPIECVILECGHMATCTNCGKVLSECPICRQYIVRVVRFFRA